MQAKFNTGGGATTGKDTATVADVRKGKTFHAGKTLKPQTGTMKDCEITNVKPGKAAQTIPKDSYIATDIQIEGDSNLVSANIKAGKSIFGVSGNENVIDTSSCNLESDRMLEGQTGGSKGKIVNGSVPTLTSSSFSPSGSTAYNEAKITGASQNSYAGAFMYKVCGYVQNQITIYIANLISANIRAGVKVGGANGHIDGSFTADATASAGDIIRGKTAGVNGSMVTGSLVGSGSATAGHVVKGKTFYNTDLQNLVTGSMEDRGTYQYAGGFGSGDGYVAFNLIPQGWYHQNGGDASWAPEVRMNRDTFKSNVINYFGIASVTNFSVAQYSSQKLLFTWANPSSGMWSGIRIVGKQGGYPSNVGDGTVICDSAGNSHISGTLATGTWYFRAWNYVTVSEGRWYGGYVQGGCYNSSISGEVTFTAGGSWTVPTAVRQIQYFLVGAGGGAYINSSNSHSRYSNGGGGGYTQTGYADVTPGQTIYITVGAGSYGGWGGSSSLSGAVNVTAGGGSPGTTDGGSGYGGSGGGGGSYGGNSYSGDGGSDGGSGGSASKNGNTPGGGQGSSTRCPWDSVLYAGGGGGGATYSSSGGAGGSGGGGAGGNYGSHGTFTDAQDGKANTGGGGGGVGHDNSNGSAESTMGGSGIVRIRW